MSKLNGPDVGSIEKTLRGQAEQAVNNGDFRRAAQMYKQLADEYPDKKRYPVLLADSLRRAGDNRDALKVIDEFLKKESQNAEGLEIKGLTLMTLGEFSEASRTFDSVMKLDGKRWRTLNAIGIMFAIKRMNPQAISYYNAALESSPDNPGVLNNLGLSLAMDRDYDKAVETLVRARNRAENGSKELKHIDLDLALVYALAGRLDDAEEVAAPHLTKAGLYNNMGFYAYISKNSELAKVYLNKALTQDPAYYDRAWKNLSAINGDNASETNADDEPQKALEKTFGPPELGEEKQEPAPPLEGGASQAAPVSPVTVASDKEANKRMEEKKVRGKADNSERPAVADPAPAPSSAQENKGNEKDFREDVRKGAKPDTLFTPPPPAQVAPSQ